MLYLSTKLYQIPLLSLRSGGRIGTAIEPIINPHNLHIDGFYCEAANNKNVQILLDIDVRDLSSRGIIINDHVNLSTPDELVRLQPVLDVNFSLLNKVALVNKKKIGKVVEFAIDKESLFIQKLYVQPRVWQSFSQDRLTFDRTNVIEVTDTYIAFRGPEVPISEKVASLAKKQFSSDYSPSASTISE